MTTSTLSTPSVASPRRPLPSQSPKGSQILQLPHSSSSDSAAPISTGDRDDVDSLRRGSLQEQSNRGKEDDEDHDDSQATLKARTKRTGSAPPTFVPGIPLYSAPSTDDPRSTDQGYVAVAKGTIGRALGLATAAASSSQATSSTGMIRSSSDGVRKALSDVAAAPRLPSLSLSRYSLFSQPNTSNPSTSASTNSPTVVHAATFAPPPSSGSPITMELDTISAEAAPPSLTLLRPTNGTAQAEEVANEEETPDDGPLIDRYGFIYDVHSGMELLKENRRRAKEKDGTGSKGEGKKKREKKEKATLALSEAETSTIEQPSGIATPTQLEVHPQLDALREAMGLTPTIEGPNVFSPQTEPPSLDFDSSSPFSAPAEPPRPPKLVRAPDSDDSTLSRLSGPQSMRALLGQLRNMSDTVERTQQTEWDAFIRKRQTKLAKIRRQQQNALQETTSGTKGKGKLKKERPKTIWGANALAEEKVEEADASREEDWTENLVGVAQMGNEGKSKKEDWNEFKELVRKGIPISYRARMRHENRESIKICCFHLERTNSSV